MEHQSKIQLSDGEVTITGRVGKNNVTYTGAVEDFFIVCDNGYDDSRDYMLAAWDRPVIFEPKYSVRINFKEVDGKQITVKTSSIKRTVTRTARIEYLQGVDVDQHRLDAGAPEGASYMFERPYGASWIEFTWKEEV